MTVRLGGVTGDANFFLLSEMERLDLGLPLSAVRPALTRARHLTSPIMDDAAWSSLRADDERVWLFYPSTSALTHPRVRSYLKRQPDKGGCKKNAFKIRSRSPWYRTPLPTRIDGFMSGMSRRGPFLVLKTMPRLNATNTLYVVRFHKDLSLDQHAAWGLALLTSHVRRQLLARGRLYADGLTKLEPGDLVNVDVPIPTYERPALSEFRRATTYVINDQIDAATDLADSWMAPFGRMNDKSPYLRIKTPLSNGLQSLLRV